MEARSTAQPGNSIECLCGLGAGPVGQGFHGWRYRLDVLVVDLPLQKPVDRSHGDNLRQEAPTILPPAWWLIRLRDIEASRNMVQWLPWIRNAAQANEAIPALDLPNR